MILSLFLSCQCITNEDNLSTISCHFEKLTSKVMENFPRNTTKSLTILCENENDENSEFEHYLFNEFNELQELKISVRY